MESGAAETDLGDHPFLAQLKALKEAFDRVQDELRRNSARLQSHFHQASSENDRIQELELDNKLLREELAALRQTPHPSTLPQSHPAVSQVQQLTLSLRKLSDQLTHTEASLLTRTTELTHTRGELNKARIQEEKAYELAARIRGREEALSSKVQEMEWKVREATEREKMAELVIGEYASLVRKLEGRASKGGAAGELPEEGLSQGRLGLKRLMGEVEGEISSLQAQIQTLQAEKEELEGKVDALVKSAEADRAAKAQADFELEKMRVDDKTAAKMVSRYMKFSQTQTDSLQTSMASIQVRHSATLSTLHSQIYNLTNQLQASEASLARFQNALEELNGDIMKEAYGRRNEVALRIKMLGREERVAEALGRWVTRCEEVCSHLGNADEPEDPQELVAGIVEEAKTLLASLDAPLVLEVEGGNVEGTASLGRLATAEYLVGDMKEELKREVALRLKVGKVVAETGSHGEMGDEGDEGDDELASQPPARRFEDVALQTDGPDHRQPEPVHESPGVPSIPGEQNTLPSPPSKAASPLPPVLASPTCSISALNTPSIPVSPSPPLPAEVLSPRAQEANDLLSELESLELEALDARRPSVELCSSTSQTAERVETPPPDVPKEQGTTEGSLQDASALAATATPNIPIEVADGEAEEVEEDGPATPTASTTLSPTPDIVVHSQIGESSILLQAEDLGMPPSPEAPFEALHEVDQIAVATLPAEEPPPAPAPPNRPPPLPLDEPIHPPPGQPQLEESPAEAEPEAGKEEEHPLIARLAETAQRYDAIQRSFRDCHLALQSLKASLPSYSSNHTYTNQSISPLPREVLEAVVERLDDFVEDARVEIEIRKGDESVLAKGFEVILKIPGALPASGVFGNSTPTPSAHPALPSASVKSPRGFPSFNSPLHSTLSLLNLSSPRVPNSPLPGPGSAGVGMTMREVEEQVEAFVDGTEPSVRKAVDGFRGKLEDVEHDIARVKSVVFGPNPTANGSPSPSLHPDGPSNGLLHPSPRHPTSTSTPPASSNSPSWSSWLRNASSPLSPPSRTASPAEPLTFGNIMTSPRLRHSPSLTSSLRKTSSATPPSGLSSTNPDTSDVLGVLRLRVPMPKFTLATKKGGNGTESGEGTRTPAQLSASRVRTISTLGMGVLGGVGGLRTASMSSLRLGAAHSMRPSSSTLSFTSSGSGARSGTDQAAGEASRNAQGLDGRKKVARVERDIDGDTDIEMDSEAETDLETETEGGNDSDFD